MLRKTLQTSGMWFNIVRNARTYSTPTVKKLAQRSAYSGSKTNELCFVELSDNSLVTVHEPKRKLNSEGKIEGRVFTESWNVYMSPWELQSRVSQIKREQRSLVAKINKLINYDPIMYNAKTLSEAFDLPFQVVLHVASRTQEAANLRQTYLKALKSASYQGHAHGVQAMAELEERLALVPEQLKEVFSSGRDLDEFLKDPTRIKPPKLPRGFVHKARKELDAQRERRNKDLATLRDVAQLADPEKALKLQKPYDYGINTRWMRREMIETKLEILQMDQSEESDYYDAQDKAAFDRQYERIDEYRKRVQETALEEEDYDQWDPIEEQEVTRFNFTSSTRLTHSNEQHSSPVDGAAREGQK
eukprot:Clim_evm100s210 gene=Clim_evmTU100s210